MQININLKCTEIMTAKHTTGPWIQSEFNKNHIVTSNNPLTSSTVAVVYGSLKDPEVAENLAIIKLAPQMLESIETIRELSYGPTSSPEGDLLHIYNMCNDILKIMK